MTATRNSCRRLLHPVTPTEAGFDPAGLDRVDAVMRGGIEGVFPAAVLLVVRFGSVVLHRTYGHLDPEMQRRPAQTGSLFDLASVTKLFTATAFMALVERGCIALDTSAADVLPKFDGVWAISSAEDPMARRLAPADSALARRKVNARQVTFWYLLTHISGLAAWCSLYQENDEGESVDW